MKIGKKVRVYENEPEDIIREPAKMPNKISKEPNKVSKEPRRFPCKNPSLVRN